MSRQDLEFDATAHQVETVLRQLRLLVADTVILSDSQEAQLQSLTEALRQMEERAAAVRHSLLTGEEMPDLDSDPGGSGPVPAIPTAPTPVRTGGAARTFEEAGALPRNP